ncbi:hypothetical protein GCM10010466_45060 [Planomonospora alba]|uniref:Uncharacterized protein n=1 Tax=Planomonospora alba TaxID=161354 RepID=A0ABP6NK47_9ACTN
MTENTGNTGNTDNTGNIENTAKTGTAGTTGNAGGTGGAGGPAGRPDEGRARERDTAAGPRDERGGRGGRDEWGGRSGRDPIGSAAEEALKLFDTLQRKAARELRKNLVKGTMTGFGSAFSGGGRGGRDVWEEAVADEQEEYVCRACPVCRAMAAQRESGGQVADHLMQAGSELFAAFKSAVDALNRPQASQRARERGASREETPVEHIDLG